MIERHMTATGIVFNRSGEILLLKHKKLGCWLPPGGHIDANELPEDAVLREIYEETGVKARILSRKKELPLYNETRCRELETPFTVLLEDINDDGRHYHIDMIYVCEADEPHLRVNEKEADEVNWFAHTRIKTLHTFENVIKVIDAAVRERAAV